MSRHTLIALAVLSVAGVAFAQEKKAATGVDQYNALFERNMFMRDRQPPRQAQPRDPNRGSGRNQPDTPASRERSTVLRGVAIEDNELHAYLENTRNGQVTRVAPGGALLGGRVEEIEIDAIAYTVDGHTAWVEIGQNLAGVRTAAAPPTENNDPAATQPTDGSAAGPGGVPAIPAGGALPPGGGSLEERMKARRAKERGGK